MSRFHRYIAALSLATLLYGRLYVLPLDLHIRMYTAWSYRDALGVTLSVLLLGLVFFLVYQLLGQTRWRNLLRQGFVFCFTFAILFLLSPKALLYLTIPHLWEICFVALLGVVMALSIGRPRWNFPRRAAQGALILSPLFLIVTYQVFASPIYTRQHEPFSASYPRKEANPVFLFICDEWSYQRSHDNGSLKPFFEYLQTFSDTSYNFKRAISPFSQTIVSVPRILYQNPLDFQMGRKGFYCKEGNRHIASHRVESLFTYARKKQYNTAVIGFHIQQRFLLGDQVDYVNTRATTDTIIPKAYLRFLEGGANRAIGLLKRAGITVSQEWVDRLQVANRRHSAHWRNVILELQDDFERVVSLSTPNTFLVTHFASPHAPFIFHPDGSYQELHVKEFDPAGYDASMGYLDRCLQRFVKAIDARYGPGKAMIIITSDHSWRSDSHPNKEKDPEQEEIRHVPLFIRLPGQKDAVQVSDKVYLTNLRPAIEAVMNGRIEEAHAALLDMAGKPVEKASLSLIKKAD